MQFIDENGNYPLGPGDVRRVAPDWDGTDATLPEGWQSVVEIPKPIPSLDQKVVLGTPTEIDGVLTQQWELVSLSDEEKVRRDAPETAHKRLIGLGFTKEEADLIIYRR